MTTSIRPVCAAAVMTVSAAALGGCHHRTPSGPVTTQARAVGSFTRIVLRAPARVDVHEGRTQTVNVTYPSEGQGDVTTRVEGDALVIDDTSSHGCSGLICIDDDSDEARVAVDLPTLSGIEISGAGDVYVEGSGEHARFEIKIDGSGDLHYAGNADVIACSIEGSGDVVLRGEGKRLEATIEGSGNVNARAFAVQGGAFSIDGSGDVYTDLHGGKATVSIHGSGDFHYSGEATFTKLDVNGSGEIERVERASASAKEL